MSDADDALRWLASAGVTPLGDGRWRDGEWEVEQTNSDLAHSCAQAIVGDEELSPSERVRHALGLLDLIDEFWVMQELAFYLNPYYVNAETDPAAAEAFWAGCRTRLEAPEVPSQLLFSLWAEWFEEPGAVAGAFAAVLGDDVYRLGDGSEALHRRADRVLRVSGPVPWTLKRDAYEKAATVPELAPALFQAILRGYHDIHGRLEPAEGLALLDRLALPPDTEHLAPLRAVLVRGAANHYRNPGLWDEAGPDC